MLLYLLFAVAAFAEECETSTCLVCKNMPGCDWYGFDCLNTTGTLVTKLDPPRTATCDMCQAGSCGDCQNQTGCGWFNSKVPGVPSKCEKSNYTSSAYDPVNSCPTCFNNNDCASCNAATSQGGSCGWYVLPGGTGGKCREASPSFAYSKVASDLCGKSLCSGIQSCTTCQNATRGSGNSTSCIWYKSSNPRFYNSKCDDHDANFAQNALYTATQGECPVCAGTSCSDCKAETGCKWVAVSTGGFGTAFGECMLNLDPTPTAKSVIATCPAECDLFSCRSCASNPNCAWFADSSIPGENDQCDLRTDKHFSQTPVMESGTCKACAATRCYECNNMPECGWYVQKVLSKDFRSGCFLKSDTASYEGRELRASSDEKCEGAPNSSAQLAASMGVVLMLAMFV